MFTNNARLGVFPTLGTGLSMTLLAVVLAATCPRGVNAEAFSVAPGETSMFFRPNPSGDSTPQHFFSVEIAEARSPNGSILIEDIDAGSAVIAATHIFFDDSGDGSYLFDVFLREISSALVNLEPLMPGLNLVGELSTDPGSSAWVSEHTELNSGKIIWSFSDGTVITVDPSAGTASVDGRPGRFSAAIPAPQLEFPSAVRITNNTPDLIAVDVAFVPLPASLSLMLPAALALMRLRKVRHHREVAGDR
ncbi:MAG: hypothetical protein AB7Q76_18425 [Gammaproteobacteria bacterium]